VKRDAGVDPEAGKPGEPKSREREEDLTRLVGARNRAFWIDQGMPRRLGATETELLRFESRYKACLPWDLLDYFAVVDRSSIRRVKGAVP
jgi:hypothetical protein